MKKTFNVHPLFKADIELAKALLDKKGYALDVIKFQTLNANRLETLQKIASIRGEINILSKVQKTDPDFLEKVAKSKEVKVELKRLEDAFVGYEEEFVDYYSSIPNFPHDSVPVGLTEEDNKTVKEHLTPTTFSFEVKSHAELGLKNDNIDFKAGVALSGSRFVVLRNEIALLHRALTQLMLDTHTSDGYEEHYLPYMVNGQALYGTGQLPKFQDDLYRIANKDDAYLIPTAEVPLTNIFAYKTIDENDLPINMTAHTPCFRSEVGSSGKDIYGLIRQHQFEKVELVKIVKAETSYDELEVLLQQAEKVMQLLKLPYRVVALCGGDLGFSAAKTYDIEVWVPSENKYREIASISNCEDFQAKRMLAKCKNKDEAHYVHTLNGSGVAVGRCMIAVMENYQQEDGSVAIPEVLIPYMKGKTEILK